MSLQLLYNEPMKKPVWDKAKKEFVQKEFVACCNSSWCVTRMPNAPRQERWRDYNLFKFSKKEIKTNRIDCPDCGSVLVWKEIPQEKPVEMPL